MWDGVVCVRGVGQGVCGKGVTVVSMVARIGGDIFCERDFSWARV